VRLFLLHYNPHSDQDMGLFIVLHESTVTIDGPCSSLHLSAHLSHEILHASNQEQVDTGMATEPYSSNDQSIASCTIRAVVGSLCGYAADIHLKITPSIADQSITAELRGPFLVDPTYYWNHTLDAEDCVTAVHSIDNMVIVGTLQGRCFVYRCHNGLVGTLQNVGFNKAAREVKQDTGSAHPHTHPQYHLEWECQLAYPIHGLCAVPDTSGNTNTLLHPPSLVLVTTKRGLHCFRAALPSPACDSSMVFNKLSRLLEQSHSGSSREQ
jgi:hypothetical protein